MMWVLGATLAAVFSTALLAFPALVAARTVVARRVAPPLARGGLERNLVLAAAVLGGVGALACADGCALALGPYGAGEAATWLAACVAPVPLAAVPWVAGEMLSGASLRPVASFSAAAAVATAISWLCYAALWAGQRHQPLSASLVAIQLPAMFLPALLAARTYLAVRGEALTSLPPEAVALNRL
jgi:hypothetical protein